MDALPLQLIGHADGDLVQVRKHVQVGHGHVGGALHQAAVAGGHCVKPAHVPGPAGLGAVFPGVAAPLPKLLSLLPGDAAGEDPGAHGAGIGLGDGDHLGDGPGGHPGPHAAVARQGGGAGGVGVDAVVGVPQGAQLAFQEDALAGFHRVMEQPGGVLHPGLQALAQGVVLLRQLIRIQGRVVVEVLQEHVFLLQAVHQPLMQQILVQHLADLDAHLGKLVGVKRRDTGLGGAKLPLAQALLLQGVQEHMEIHQHLGPVGDAQPGVGDVPAQDAVQLVQKGDGVQRHPGADDVHHLRVEDARGHQVEGKLAVLVDDGVAGIGPALEAHHQVGMLRQHVGQFALALIAPVGTNNRTNHVLLLLFQRITASSAHAQSAGMLPGCVHGWKRR